LKFWKARHEAPAVWKLVCSFCTSNLVLGEQGVVSVLSDEGSPGTQVLGGLLPAHRAPSFISSLSCFAATFTSRKGQMYRQTH